MVAAVSRMRPPPIPAKLATPIPASPANTPAESSPGRCSRPRLQGPTVRATIDGAHPDAARLGVEPVAHPTEEPGEGAEDQRPVALGAHLSEVVDEQVELRQTHPVLLGVDERGVEGRLA